MNKTNKVFFIIILLLLFLLVGIIVYFTGNSDVAIKEEVIILTERNRTLELALENQKKHTDSLSSVLEKQMASLTPDTVYININKKHDKNIATIKQLPPDSQVRILARWLSKADSL